MKDKNSFEVLKSRLELGKVIGRQNSASIRFGSFVEKKLRDLAARSRERVAFRHSLLDKVVESELDMSQRVTFSPKLSRQFNSTDQGDISEFTVYEGDQDSFDLKRPLLEE